MTKNKKIVFLNDEILPEGLHKKNTSTSDLLYKDDIYSLNELKKECSLFIFSNKKDDTKAFIDRTFQSGITKTPNCFLVSDKKEDLLAAKERNITGFYVLTTKGSRCIGDLPQNFQVFHNLTEVVDRILEKTYNQKENNFCSINEGAENIKNGGLTAFPTETVYGLGASVFYPDSVRKIFELKNRPLFDPLISHISNIEMLKLIADDIKDQAWELIKNFWPGPLTLVFKKRNSVNNIITGNNPTIAVRMPANTVALEFIEKAGSPIAAPSANSFGKTSPTTAKHVIEQLGCKGYLIIDGGACRVGVESTVLLLTTKTPKILRQGGISQERIEKLIGSVNTIETPLLKTAESPGMLENHYAPETPLLLKELPILENNDPNTGLLLFGDLSIKSNGPIENLSPEGNLEEAATKLYSAIRRLDKLKLKRIIAYSLPNKGMGRAINDRIKKASIKD